MCKQFKCNQSYKFVKFLTRNYKTKASVSKFLARRRQASKVLEELASHRGSKISSTVVTPGVRVTFSKNKRGDEKSTTTVKVSRRASDPVRERNRKRRSVACKDKRIVKQKGHSGNARMSARFFQSGVSETEAHRRLASHIRCVTTERKSEGANVQNGHQSSYPGSNTSRDVGDKRGLFRRIPPHTYQKSTQTVPLFSSGQNSVLVHSTPIWVISSSESVHDGAESDQGVGASPAHDNIPVSRRLAELKQTTEGSRVANANVCGQVRIIGTYSQPSEVRIGTDTGDCISRSNIQLHHRQSVPYGREIAHYCTKSGTVTEQTGSKIEYRRKPVRQTDSNRENSTTGTVKSQVISEMCKTSDTQGPYLQPLCRDDTGSMARVSVVDRDEKRDSGSEFSPTKTNLGGANRRVHTRLGSVSPGEHVPGKVDKYSKPTTHQCLRDEGGRRSAQIVGTQVAKYSSVVLRRQHNSSFVYHKAGGHAFGVPHASNPRGICISTASQHSVTSPSYSGGIERVGGSSVATTTSSQHRMAAKRRSFSVDRKTISVGQTSGRLVRKQSESPAGTVHISVPRPRCDSNRRVGLSVATHGIVRIPTGSTSSSSSGEDGTGNEPESTVDSSVDTQCELVSTDQVMGGPRTATNTDQAGDAQATALEPLAPGPITHGVAPVVSENTLLIERGFSARVISQLRNVRAKSTSAIYNSKWKLFTVFCDERGINSFGAGAPVVAEFLQWVFDTRTASVRTVQGYRSAIAAKLKVAS